ncbi:hypothetical protein EDD15DRAFT_1510829 [Pisolithus albus]|nr:hypothetical protein EDD15DRAFT_1510829 [Pisolithus albus]
MIKEKKANAFHGLDANELEIYHTSQRVASWPHDDEKGLMQALANDSHGRLSGRGVLSATFNRPLVPHGIHILVQPPPTLLAVPQVTISLNCLVLGDTRNHIFTVDLAISENVGVLRKAIKAKKLNAFCDVDADQLSLYRTSLPDDGELEGKLRSLNYDEPLQPTSILAKIFPVLPDASHLHIVVQPPHEEQNDILTELNECGDRCSALFM